MANGNKPTPANDAEKRYIDSIDRQARDLAFTTGIPYESALRGLNSMVKGARKRPLSVAPFVAAPAGLMSMEPQPANTAPMGLLNMEGY